MIRLRLLAERITKNFMYNVLSQTTKKLSDRLDNALVEGLVALDKGDMQAFTVAYEEARNCRALLSSINAYLTHEVMSHKEELCLH